MVRTIDYIRLIIELICGLILVGFIGTVMLMAAFMMGWPMALGMGIVFFLEIIKIIKSHQT